MSDILMQRLSEMPSSLNDAMRTMDLAKEKIEHLRALLVYARVELTGISTSAETIAKIDAALDRDQQRLTTETP